MGNLTTRRDHIMDNCLERIVPDLLRDDEVTGAETLRLHVERYRFASKHLRAGRVLDIACGVGYGTDIILQEAADRVSQIHGVDISKEAIEYARRRYAHPRAQFVLEDATTFFDGEGFDTIVSLETLEHLPNPDHFASRLVRMLRPNGMLICSAPTSPSVDINPYHLTDFTEGSFRRIFERHGLIEVESMKQIQPYRALPVLSRKEERSAGIRSNLLSYYLTHPRSIAKRIAAIFLYGFSNHYITAAWRSPRS
jgi:2-polyprenyl-3-methyl-5-hydroxy-6-metoxy-1,4-benzoquinol methylase